MKSIKSFASLVFVSMALLACGPHKNPGTPAGSALAMQGTWKLLKGVLIEKGDTTVTDYTGGISFIKIINDSHFAFLQHDLKTGRDSMKVFVAGGGRYSLKDSIYPEHLEYCNDRVWEGNDFSFVVRIHGDTLIQRGIEKVQEAGVDRVNQETYIRLK